MCSARNQKQGGDSRPSDQRGGPTSCSSSSSGPLSSPWKSLPKRPLAPQTFKRSIAFSPYPQHISVLRSGGLYVTPPSCPPALKFPLGEFSYTYFMKWGPQAGPLQAANWKPCQKWEEEAEGEKQQRLTRPPHIVNSNMPPKRAGLAPSQQGVLPLSWENLGTKALRDSAWQMKKGCKNVTNSPPDTPTQP